TWKLRARRFDSELRAFCNEAISDGRHDRLAEIADDISGLRQEILDVVHVRGKGERATRPYPWWAREWMRTTHWLLWAKIGEREERIVKIRNRLMGPKRDADLLNRGEDQPKRLIDRLVWRLFG